MRTVLYTAILQGSDALKRAPSGPDACICYTDDPALAGGDWTMRHLPSTAFARQEARRLKTNSIALFPDADVVVWADGSMTITDWPRLLRDAGEADVACLPHPDRHDCYAEGETVIRLQIGGARAVTRLMDRFRADGFAPTELSTTGLMVRRCTPAVERLNALWLELIEAYGINDQVQFDFCAWKAGVTRTWLHGHYRANPYMVYDQRDHARRRVPQYLPDPS